MDIFSSHATGHEITSGYFSKVLLDPISNFVVVMLIVVV